GHLTLSGDGLVRIFHINPALLVGVDVEIRGLTLTRGSRRIGGILGGAILNQGNLSLSDSTLTSSSAHFGGGIYNNGNLTATNCTFVGNFAIADGGGIYNRGSLTV